MTKKNTRPKAKAAAKPATKPVITENEIDIPAPAPVTAEVRIPKTPKVSRSQAAAERIEDEYAFITDDLRRVFILAGAMFALLIALNIILGLIG